MDVPELAALLKTMLYENIENYDAPGIRHIAVDGMSGSLSIELVSGDEFFVSINQRRKGKE